MKELPDWNELPESGRRMLVYVASTFGGKLDEDFDITHVEEHGDLYFLGQQQAFSCALEMYVACRQILSEL